MSSSVRSGAVRPNVRQGSVRPSNARFGSSMSAAMRFADRGGAVSPADSLISGTTSGTKRKERDFESDAGISVTGGEETNINVVVRCRGRSEREVKENSAVLVNTEGVKGKLIELSMGANALSHKAYNFDRVFSAAADQRLVFDDTVKPILDEVGTPMKGTRRAATNRRPDAGRVQLHHLCVWTDRHWKDLHDVGRHDRHVRHAV